jgi:hypothetical protein
MAELLPGVLEAVFTRIVTEAQGRSRAALSPIAALIERQAKINASTGKHGYGTKTPAWPGTGPAQISGTLVASIDHSPIILGALGWETKVGTAANKFPTYGSRTSKTSSSKYGLILEKTGLRNGSKYPFLEPAFTFVVRGPARYIYDEMYGAAGWLHLA